MSDLVAHELAHIYQWALGGPSEDYDDPLSVELDADELMERWGFDPDAVDEWDEEHGVIKTVNIDPSTPAGKRAEKRVLARIFKYGR